MSLEKLQQMNGRPCRCGRTHRHHVSSIICRKGALNELSALLKRNGVTKPFILCDATTASVIGESVRKLLEKNGFGCTLFAIPDKKPEPDERTAGSAFMNFETSCDAVIGVGSGVINDMGKLLSAVTNRFYAIVATAPSVDGYASATSSVVRDGLKVSLDTRCPDVIIADTDILRNAPLPMLQAGLGDMLAKYVCLAEWRISHIINGEYYCPEIDSMITEALEVCTKNACKLAMRDEEAVKDIFEGLIITGIAMTYAGSSRPASGTEHYISHGWDMRHVEFGTPCSLHGIQCAIGTLVAIRAFERLRKCVPDKSRALGYVGAFDYNTQKEQLRRLYGRAAEEMIKHEEDERKFDKAGHAGRLETIVNLWDEICDIIDQLPSSGEIERLLSVAGAPTKPEEAGLETDSLPDIFKATKDIRDKYILTRLLWDLGLLDEITPL